MSKPVLNMVSFSGGKDSTAMLLRMLEEGMQVDIILFCDTGLEFPQLYEHVKKVEQNIGRPITVVKCKDDFEYLFAEKPIKRKKKTQNAERYGLERNGYSWAGPKMRWCTQVLKDAPREHFLSELKKEYDIIEYVGLAADEGYRLQRKCNQRANMRLPLVEWGMTEADCLQYCYDRGYDWEGLYTKMKRVSCWCCPLQSLDELRVLYREFPDLWAQLRRWDDMTWRPFRADYSVRELELRFDFEDEWLKAGKKLRTKEFYSALYKRLERLAEAV